MGCPDLAWNHGSQRIGCIEPSDSRLKFSSPRCSWGRFSLKTRGPTLRSSASGDETDFAKASRGWRRWSANRRQPISSEAHDLCIVATGRALEFRL